jgi:tetratricopeptide (TPR) repeat protein
MRKRNAGRAKHRTDLHSERFTQATVSAKVLFFSVLVPFFLFVLLELGLWAAGVETLFAERDPFLGFSRQAHVYHEDPARGVYATTAAAAKRSFNSQQFQSRKPDNGFRIFVLGGSSAWGFPWGAEVAFTKVLGDALQSSWPERRVEAVNAAAMSYGSNRMRVLAHEVAGYEPDAVILFEGHNEFVENRFYTEVVDRRESLDRINGVLDHWRLYSLLFRFAERLRRGGSNANPGLDSKTTGELIGLDVAREDATGKGEEEKRLVRVRFEENLRAIVDLLNVRGRVVVLCTVPSNVRDWAPNQSLFEPGLNQASRKAVLDALDRSNHLLGSGDAAGAAGVLEEAARTSPGYAETHFRLGHAYEVLSRWADARAAYMRARDLDAQPARVLSAFNDTIRRVAAERGAMLVDVERFFEGESPHGLVGFNLIEDYVHPKPIGHWIIARELWKTLNGRLQPGRPAGDFEFQRAAGAPPESDGSSVAASTGVNQSPRRTARLLYNLGIVFEHQKLTDQAIEKYRACLALDPSYDTAAFNLGRLLDMRGDYEAAAEQFRHALAFAPNSVDSLRGLGLDLFKLGKPAEAEAMLTRATTLDPSIPAAWNLLGAARVRQEKMSEGIGAFRKAVELDPQNASFLYNLGAALRREGQLDEAIHDLRAALAIVHEDVMTQDELADALASKGELAEAAKLYGVSLGADPRDHHAREALAALAPRQKGGI